ncbi:RsfA family transcriptional regulator [Pullulanibacillus sp. KACC 23026]|uniref:RsfA family transcriptional regulator n=1 Tax=Pullulanibacillus sp. KACC 23026 TaxID=3028315 RepID=UPI0023AEBC36|nr:RsfA family transcriptional regulator [Pullulanibacillus sp. KACC 23026]WEG14086.1 RsfA family transcriptional regulator [Pullulanibacillus sp. KACC 23026]
MTKVRQDAWSHEDDLLLAETVLRHIREGSTQLDAFEEVGDKLNRTGAACGFRWNAIVRKKYLQAIEIAKKQRKQMKRAQQRRPRTWQPPVAEPMDDYPLFTANSEVPAPAQPSSETLSTAMDYEMGQESQLSLADVVQFLQNLQSDGASSNKLKRENEKLREQNELLQNQVKGLEKEVAKMKRDHLAMEEDYQSLIGIMERARRMAFLQDDSEEDSSPAFKMDKNGNLEKLAK